MGCSSSTLGEDHNKNPGLTVKVVPTVKGQGSSAAGAQQLASGPAAAPSTSAERRRCISNVEPPVLFPLPPSRKKFSSFTVREDGSPALASVAWIAPTKGGDSIDKHCTLIQGEDWISTPLTPEALQGDDTIPTLALEVEVHCPTNGNGDHGQDESELGVPESSTTGCSTTVQNVPLQGYECELSTQKGGEDATRAGEQQEERIKGARRISKVTCSCQWCVRGGIQCDTLSTWRRVEGCLMTAVMMRRDGCVGLEDSEHVHTVGRTHRCVYGQTEPP